MHNALISAHELLRRGALREAESACQQALAATNGRDPQAWTTLGIIMRQQGRLSDAESAYRRAIALSPTDVSAHHALGALLSQMERAEEALSALNHAQSLGLNARELHINRGRALLQLYHPDEAEQDYARAVALEPRDPVAQSSLAQLRFMRGDPAFARDIAAAAIANPTDPALQLALGDLMRRSGNLPAAETVLRAVIRSQGPVPELRAALAAVLHEAGRLKEAEIEALEASVARPHDAAILESLIGIVLGRGRPDEAMPLIRAQRRKQPQDQRWIAYEATAARLLQEPLYRELYDYERLVRVYDIEPPPGWSSVAELNAAVAEKLRARHRFNTHPLDQSLRNGSQTARSLLTEPDPTIQALLGAFAAPIAAYVASLGSERDHPISGRNRGGAALKGCWSVELRRNGFHVNHVHPQGWISSAYYVAVPPDVADAAAKSGWIKFGEPGVPVAGAGAEHFVQPRPGRLVLFPSYMWHGTNAITGDETRLTVAFDAVPV
ncbi:MAG TPA: putative 2OG-Fe(II) oxygenase [Steroidobacteraceae bacterium]|nr:putative 2OG-Fe(II) oxygenase [Steroidobacteraceae bacterium]